MKFLRLLDSNRQNKEYYVNGLPALFLADIKSLNIIIGANNSRKSRFLRKIIGLEQKVILVSKCDFNQILQRGSTIFQRCRDEELMNQQLIQFSFHTTNSKSEEFLRIEAFFSGSYPKTLGFSGIESLFKQLNDSILSLGTPDEAINAKQNFENIFATIKLVNDTYSLFDNHYRNKLSKILPTPVSGIGYVIPSLSHQIKDLKSKQDILKEILMLAENYKEIVLEVFDVNMIYIPVLRTSRRLIRTDNKVFENTLMNHYKIEKNPKLILETGLDLYEKIDINRNGLMSSRDNFRDFENFISEAFFENKRIEIVAVRDHEGRDTHIKISIEGEMDDVSIHDLGDGIQGIINLLFPVFTAKDNTWVFIDEPENHLHPGYQNLFVRTIANHPKIKAKNLKFFINTHSNHILTEGMLGSKDTEILVFSRRDKDSSNILSFAGNEYHTLEMLGVFNTSVLISNCSIWVEGVTDRLYLRAFLQAYWRSLGNQGIPTEGLNYSFMEYAGNNIVHYNFDHEIKQEEPEIDRQIKAFFLNSKIFLLADSDFSKEARHAFYEEVSVKRDNFQYFKTELPEIENILPDSILQSWLTEVVKCDPKEVKLRFKTKIGKEKLGKYFDEKFTKGATKRRFMKDNEGGTLRSDLKASLCDYVHNGVLSNEIKWDELKTSPMLLKLVEQVHAFIKSAKVGF